MFYLPLSKFQVSNEAVVAPGAVFLAEGQAMVRQPGATAAGVMPSTGVADEVFCGFSIAGVSAAPFPEGYANKVENFVVPATGIITLQQEPVAGQFIVIGGGAAGTLAGKSISGLTAGNKCQVIYRYALSVVQARALYGDVQPGGYAGAQVGQIGQIKSGVVFTSEFDASVDWAAAEEVKLGANGQLTDKGTGVTIKAVVIALPSQDIPFLGIEFSA